MGRVTQTEWRRVEVEWRTSPVYLAAAKAWDHQQVEVTRHETTYPRRKDGGIQWSKGATEATTFTVARADLPDLIGALAWYLADFTMTELEDAK